MLIPLDAITIGPGHRKVRAAEIKKLTVSISTIGLRTPITVRPGKEPGKYILVAGRHRLEVHRKLGLKEIEAHIGTDDRLDAALWETAENLHRADLTAMQRAIAEGQWIKLRAQKIKRDQRDGRILRQVGGKKPQPHRATGERRGRPREGISVAAEELGIAETTARRSVRIAEHLTSEAQAEAVKLGLDDNQHALARAAGAPPDRQVASLHSIAERRQEREASQQQIARVMAGIEPPAGDGSGWFEFHYWRSDSQTQRTVRNWLRGLDPLALADELEAAAVASAVH